MPEGLQLDSLAPLLQSEDFFARVRQLTGHMHDHKFEGAFAAYWSDGAISYSPTLLPTHRRENGGHNPASMVDPTSITTERSDLAILTHSHPAGITKNDSYQSPSYADVHWLLTRGNVWAPGCIGAIVSKRALRIVAAPTRLVLFRATAEADPARFAAISREAYNRLRNVNETLDVMRLCGVAGVQLQYGDSKGNSDSAASLNHPERLADLYR